MKSDRSVAKACECRKVALKTEHTITIISVRSKCSASKTLTGLWNDCNHSFVWSGGDEPHVLSHISIIVKCFLEDMAIHMLCTTQYQMNALEKHYIFYQVDSIIFISVWVCCSIYTHRRNIRYSSALFWKIWFGFVGTIDKQCMLKLLSGNSGGVCMYEVAGEFIFGEWRKHK